MKKMILSCLLALLLCAISAMAHAGKTVVVPGSSAAYLFLPLGKTTVSAVDTTPPTTSYVNVVSTLATNASFKTKIDEDGTGCHLVQTSAPTVDAIKSGNCQAMTANTEKIFTGIGGLTAGSTYKIYFLAKDSAGNWQTSYFTSATFTATDVCTTQAVDVLKDTCCYAKNSDHYSYGRAGLGYSATGSGDSLGVGTIQTYLKKTNAYGSNWWNKVTSCP